MPRAQSQNILLSKLFIFCSLASYIIQNYCFWADNYCWWHMKSIFLVLDIFDVSLLKSSVSGGGEGCSVEV